MRELGDAVSVRNHIIDCFELAAQEQSAERRAALLRFVVVGGGPTGVELMAEIRDLIQHGALRALPRGEPGRGRTWCWRWSILPGWHPTVVRRATDQCTPSTWPRALTGRRVQSVSEFAVALDGGETLAARTTVGARG